MSYSIKLKSADGTVVVESVSGTVPDGTWGIHGHEDATYAYGGVGESRARPDGSYVAQATALAYPVPAEVTA